MNRIDGYTIHDVTGAELGWYPSAEDAAYHFRQIDDAALWRQVRTGALMGHRSAIALRPPLETNHTPSYSLDGCVHITVRGAA